MLTYAEIKRLSDRRMQELDIEVKICLMIADLVNDVLEENACYERIVELEREMKSISDHLWDIKHLSEKPENTLT